MATVECLKRFHWGVVVVCFKVTKQKICNVCLSRHRSLHGQLFVDIAVVLVTESHSLDSWSRYGGNTI